MKKFNYYALALSNMIVKVITFVGSLVVVIKLKNLSMTTTFPEWLAKVLGVSFILLGVTAIISIIYYIYEERSKAILVSSSVGLLTLIFIVKGFIDLTSLSMLSSFFSGSVSIPGTLIFGTILAGVGAVYDVLVYFQMAGTMNLNFLSTVTPVPSLLKGAVTVANPTEAAPKEEAPVQEAKPTEAAPKEEAPVQEVKPAEAAPKEEAPVQEEVQATQESPQEETPVVEDKKEGEGNA